ncbi:carbohydrate ABC transporter membrane protein 2, CUT1 family [Halorubrum ezzemoulense]|uniref:Carbohydrate ABC transporter membrane protein 2, CUT1 family n=1 Tax=Halorubrum ezzemoulense TaxID=337243 RepID=A0A238YF30_HALEZ|nr:carbohydrate ABC transporter permease [Halorubrum ezzemoulense]SNR69876.1 carbohydrate ABC transporter membrane protein 2, CUT1 family [Halorubrum ezzemoulense]
MSTNTITQSIRESYLTTSRAFSRLFGSQEISSSRLERAAFYTSIVLVLFIALFPFYIMLKTSVTPDANIYSQEPQLVPDEMTLEHYRVLFSPETFPFITYFRNSLLVSTVTAGLSVVVATLGGYSFARLEYRGRGLTSRLVLVVYMFSGILLVVPLFQVMTWLGLVDTLPSLLITYLVQTLPLSLYMLGNYFRSVPEEIEEAALMDGYSRLEVIYRITIPLSAPAIVAVFIYAFMIAWNEYLFASVLLRSQGLFTLPIGLEALNQAFENVWGQLMAASILTSIPVVVLFLYLEKYLVEGLTFGAVEG